MKLIPTWPIAASLLALGVGVGVYVDHTVMAGRIDRMNSAHAEELRQREVQRANDEKLARDREAGWVQKLSDAEQRRIDENLASSNAADALRQRLRNQAASKPANPGGMPQATASCETAARGAISNGTGEDYVRLAERADQVRSALSACYQAYDSVAR